MTGDGSGEASDGRARLIFLSHAGIDTPAAKALKERLLAAPDAAGLSVWFDKDDLKADQDYQAAIARAVAFVVYVNPRGVINWVDRPGEPLVLRGHEDEVFSGSFSPDSERIVTASQDGTVRVWRADGTGEPVVLLGPEDGIIRASFSPDGERIVTASVDGTARVWRADGTGEPVVLLGPEKLVRAAAFSPDGERIVTASRDGTARVWRADGIGEPMVLRGHEDGVFNASFSPDGKRIVTASADGSARIWRVDGTGEPVVLRGHEDGVFRASFSPDGGRIVTASKDKTARVWRISVQEALVQYACNLFPNGLSDERKAAFYIGDRESVCASLARDETTGDADASSREAVER